MKGVPEIDTTFLYGKLNRFFIGFMGRRNQGGFKTEPDE